MKDIDVHRLIEQQEPEAKERMWQRIKAELNLPDAPQPAPVVAKPKQWKKWTAIAAALVCVITLSIVLPLTLGGEKVRFYDSKQYTTESLEQNLGDYFSSNNKKLLYVDWYGSAEEIKTRYGHINGNANDVVFYSETIINGETGETLTVYITDNKTRVDILDNYYVDTQEFNVNNISVQYKSNRLISRAMFEYNSNNYYLEIDIEDAQERLTEIIENMLP